MSVCQRLVKQNESSGLETRGKTTAQQSLNVSKDRVLMQEKQQENICCWLEYQPPHMCVILHDACRSAEENEGIGGVHKQAGKLTLGCKAKTSVSSQLPCNSEAMLAMAPSECGVGGVMVYTMANRMYASDPANS